MTRLLAAISLALLIALGVMSAYAIHERHNAERNALAYSNEVAEHDTTRAVGKRALDAAKKVYGDSIRVVERRAVQAEIARDALDKAQHRNTTTRVTATGSVAAINGKIGATDKPPRSPLPVVGVTDTTTRVASFHLRREPFTLDATASLPYDRAGTLDYSVALDSAQIVLRLGCNRTTERGVSAAVATAVTPQWLRLRFDRVEQSSDICARNIATDKKRARRWGIGGTLGYGYVYDSQRREFVRGTGALLGLSFRF